MTGGTLTALDLFAGDLVEGRILGPVDVVWAIGLEAYWRTPNPLGHSFGVMSMLAVERWAAWGEGKPLEGVGDLS